MGKSKKLSTDGRSGGLLVGKTDIDGGIGIPATVGGSRNVILGGGEIIINEAAAKLHCEKLDEINQSTGGRSIDCEAQKTANKGRFDGGGMAGGGDEDGKEWTLYIKGYDEKYSGDGKKIKIKVLSAKMPEKAEYRSSHLVVINPKENSSGFSHYPEFINVGFPIAEVYFENSFSTDSTEKEKYIEKYIEGGEVGDKNELDKEIFLSLLKIYKSEGNSGKDLFSFSEYKLGKILSQNAFDRIKSGKSPLGKFGLYGGGLGQYYALDIANGDFYKRISENYAKGGGMAYGGNFTDFVLYHVTEKENREDIQSDGLLKSEGVVWLSIDGKSLQLLVEDGDFSLPGRPKPELDIWQVRIPEKELGKLKGGYDMGFLDDWSAYSGNIPVEWIKLIDKKDWNNHYAGGGNFTGTKQSDKASEDDLATLKAKVEKLLSDNGININELEVRTLKTWGGDVRVYLGSMTTQNKKTSFRKTGQTEKVGNQTRHYGERGVHETKTRNYVVFNEADFKEYDDNPKYSMINYNIEEIKKHYFADGGGMYWMGNEGDRVVVDKSGQGDFTSYYLIREKSPHDMVSMSFDSRFEAEKYAKRRKMVLVDKYVDAKGTVENKKTGKAIIVSYEKDKDVKNQVGLAIENIIYPYDYKITKGDKSFDFPKKKTVYFYKITPKNEGDMEKIVGSLGVLVSSKKILSIYQDSTDKYAGGGMADGEIDKAFDRSDRGSLNSFQELAKKYNGGGKLSDSISDIKDGEIRVFTENIKKLLSFVGEGMDIDFYPNQNEVVIQFTENAWGGINVDTWNRVDSLLKNLEGKNGFSEFQLNPSHNKILLVFENGNNEIGLY